MRFRPCIDIHNGKVKQIVGSSLRDAGDAAVDNFVSEKGAGDFAQMYAKDGLTGGHIILLNAKDSDYYEATKAQALEALSAYPGGMQIGGGITAENAAEFLKAGASHVIVTSYVFKDGKINYDNLKALVEAVGKEHIVLDLSCRKREGSYYIVTDRWQKFTTEKVTIRLLEELSAYCDEYLIHAVDVEGKVSGIEQELAALLGTWGKLPVTYAGGVSSLTDLELLKQLGKEKLDVTIGSALDIFGGKLPYEEIVKRY
jgi:phosphoribosylformimino-5-aminoimidazole carboxamide ribotide isomerase